MNSSGLLTIDFFEMQSNGGARFDDSEPGSGTRSPGDESVTGPALIQGGRPELESKCSNS